MMKARTKMIGRIAVLCIPLLSLGGCAQAPAFNILGSYFPAWLFCLAVGMVLTVVTRAILRKRNLATALSPPLLMYSSLTAFFTFVLWLIFFRT